MYIPMNGWVRTPPPPSVAPTHQTTEPKTISYDYTWINHNHAYYSTQLHQTAEPYTPYQSPCLQRTTQLRMPYHTTTPNNHTTELRIPYHSTARTTPHTHPPPGRRPPSPWPPGWRRGRPWCRPPTGTGRPRRGQSGRSGSERTRVVPPTRRACVPESGDVPCNKWSL